MQTGQVDRRVGGCLGEHGNVAKATPDRSVRQVDLPRRLGGHRAGHRPVRGVRPKSVRRAGPHVLVGRHAPAARQHAEKNARFASPNIHSLKFHSFSFEASAFIMPNPCPFRKVKGNQSAVGHRPAALNTEIGSGHGDLEVVLEVRLRKTLHQTPCLRELSVLPSAAPAH